MKSVIKRNIVVLIFAVLISLFFVYQTNINSSANNVYNLTLTGNILYLKLI